MPRNNLGFMRIRRRIASARYFDPTTGLILLAGWAACSSLSLLLPGEAFAINPIYWALKGLGIPEEAWGAAMLLDGVALLMSVVWCSTAMQAALYIVSGAGWMFFGYELLVGAAQHGLFSGGGAFSIFGALACFCAAAQTGHRGPQ